MSKKKKFSREKTGMPIYNNTVIYVERNDDGSLFFECGDTQFGSSFVSSDPCEVVSAVMRLKGLNDERFWKIQVLDSSDVLAEKSLYWLSGGDALWKSNTYIYKWIDIYESYEKEFAEKIYDIFDKCKTLLDIKRNFQKDLNLSIFYEFALENGFLNLEK